MPGIIEGAKDGKGRGKQVIAVARTCNIIFICLDVLKPLGHKKILENELEGFGIRLTTSLAACLKLGRKIRLRTPSNIQKTTISSDMIRNESFRRDKRRRT